MTDQRHVTAMFNDIAPRYDFLNHLLSFHLDTVWRRKLSKTVSQKHPSTILDVATGTADLAIQLAKDHPQAQVTGIDLSQTMLDIGQNKIDKLNLANQIHLTLADAQRLPFPDHHFDAVTVAFGVRNFENPQIGLQEMHRVVKPEGLVAILEFSTPEKRLVKLPYQCYSKHLLPRIGNSLSKHPSAYNYLPESIQTFYQPKEFTQLMEKSGFSEIQNVSLSGGIVTLYLGNA